MARGGEKNWAGPKVRTRAGYMVTARINNGQVEVLDETNNSTWTEYPEKGKNLNPNWRPTPAQKGFTLIELMIVVVIIAFVALLAVGGIVIGVAACKGCDKADQFTYSECVEACAQLEGEEAEKFCMEKCD